MMTQNDAMRWPSRHFVLRLLVVYLAAAASGGVIVLFVAAAIAHPWMVLPFCIGVATGLAIRALSRAAQRRTHGWQGVWRHRAI